MISVPVSPRRVFGVDFSGASDAGRGIWICRGHPGPEGIRIESVDPLATLPGGAVDRAPALRALVQKVLDAPRSAWGLDFSFGLPRRIAASIAAADRPGGWGDLLEAVAAFGDAEAFRHHCREQESNGELRRKTDVEAATPFSPYNMRAFRQTFHGMTGVLRPLRGRADVAVLPFDPLPAATGRPGRLPPNLRAPRTVPQIYLMEVCPASVLWALGYPRRGYKGRTAAKAGRRRAILSRLIDDRLVRPPPRGLRERILSEPGGNALDSLVAAVGAWRGYRGHDHGALRGDPSYAVEGFVYT